MHLIGLLKVPLSMHIPLFLYDVDGTIISVNMNGEEYFYIRNLQQDIVALADKNGTIVAEYIYDAWDNILNLDEVNANSIARLNPYRYRGYRYDAETGRYYLNSRYYDPEIGRFINADDVRYLEPALLNGLNLYAYSGNNPVMYLDPNGNSFILAMLIGAGIGALVGGVSYTASEGISYLFNGEFSWSWEMFGVSILGGAIGGALTPFLGPGATAFITGTSTSAIGMALENATGKGDYSFGEIFYTSLMIGSISAVTAGVIDNIPISGVNSGRGSLTAISKQINTKLVKNQISRISMKTFGKMAYLNFIYSSPSIVVNGYLDGLTLKPEFGW